MFLVYNSDILSETAFSLPVNDRAFQYGDGLFETVRYEAGQVWFWTDHYTRLMAGATNLQLHLPATVTAESLYQRIITLLQANKLTEHTARIKIQLWRKTGGLYTPTQNHANLLITTQAGTSFSISEKTNLGIFHEYRLSPSPMSAFKTLNALPYVLAGLYRKQYVLDDVVLLDTYGNVAECLASNIFWITDQTLYTPSLQTGCINGIMRQQLIRLVPNLREGMFTTSTLTLADAVFCSNVMGIQWFRNLNGVPFATTAFQEAQALLNPFLSQLYPR